MSSPSGTPPGAKSRRYTGEGCQDDVHSCRGSEVLVHEAAEAVAALDIAAGRWHELWRFERLERESAVRAFAVVVLDVGAQDPLELAAADDHKPVEAFRAHRG
jgi:hypothetical protein